MHLGSKVVTVGSILDYWSLLFLSSHLQQVEHLPRNLSMSGHRNKEHSLSTSNPKAISSNIVAVIIINIVTNILQIFLF